MPEETTTIEPPKPKPGRKPKKQRAPRVVKKREFRVECQMVGTDHWRPCVHGDEVKDTRTGLEWIKANAQADVAHRIIVVCAQVTKRTKQVAVLE